MKNELEAIRIKPTCAYGYLPERNMFSKEEKKTTMAAPKYSTIWTAALYYGEGKKGFDEAIEK